MSVEDRKVCMVDDMEELTPLAEAYARARGTSSNSFIFLFLKIVCPSCCLILKQFIELEINRKY